MTKGSKLKDLFSESVFKSNSYLGESPLWSKEQQLLYWVDIKGKMIHIFDPKTKYDISYPTQDLVTAVALQNNNAILVALRKQIVSFDCKTGKTKVLSKAEENDPDTRFNDGKCDCRGRFWIGTINTRIPTSNACTLYSFDGIQIKPVLHDIMFSNGLAWSPDHRTFFHVESFRKAIFAYDFNAEKGSLTHKRLFVSLNESTAYPDGITVDDEEGVWCAHYGGSQVVRYDRTGKISVIIKLPVPHVTNCCFGGENLDTLYITTAQENLSPDQLKKHSLSGSLFAIKVDYKGILETPFCGIL